jgi:hypothetical protein
MGEICWLSSGGNELIYRLIMMLKKAPLRGFFYACDKPGKAREVLCLHVSKRESNSRVFLDLASRCFQSGEVCRVECRRSHPAEH